MILRRVIAHVRKQEWTAIAIDLVIVVLGVVIGIQVSNWNAERADRKRAHGYLERIRDDLDADIAGYRDRLDFWGEVSTSGAKGLAYAETGDPGGATVHVALATPPGSSRRAIPANSTVVQKYWDITHPPSTG